MSEPVPYPPEAHDFDFIHGQWTVANRRLKTRGVGADDWDVFASTAFCEPRLGGLANVEEVSCPERGWTGMAVRAFDREQGQWSVWWISSLTGQLQTPVTGRFGSDGCVLEGEDLDGDWPIRARYIWSDIKPDSARWTQAFSYDDGSTWETNWVMDFARETP
ncbi:MAG TPA: DUF1579 domain-containing protein [Brevundimonas sp.]